MASRIGNLENLNTILNLATVKSLLHRKKWALAANKLNKLHTNQKFIKEVRKITGLGTFLNKLHVATVHTKARRHFEPEYVHPNLQGSANKMNNFMKLYRTHQRTMPIRRSMAARKLQNAFRSRPTHQLISNMANEISMGRGHTINATTFTPFEKKKLVKHLKNAINASREARNSYRNAKTSTNAQVRAHAIERYGYYNNHVRAYARGLRAVKPVKGFIPVQYRAAANSPNRPARAPANRLNNVNQFSSLENPHLVVRVPGLEPFYMNPNTFQGIMKSNARVNIAIPNIKAWLRMARATFPNKTLFRHPHIHNRNITARHIRFSSA